jgi:hypothetical protein
MKRKVMYLKCFLIFGFSFYASAGHLVLTDRSEDGKIMKFQIKSAPLKTFIKSERLSFSFQENQEQGKKCESVISKVEPKFLIVKVINNKVCWDLEKKYLRTGTHAYIDGLEVLSREVDLELKQKDLEQKKLNYLTQLNNINIYMHSFSLKKKRIEALYDKKLKELFLEKNKALEDLYKQRAEKSQLRVDLNQKVQRLKTAGEYYSL